MIHPLSRGWYVADGTVVIVTLASQLLQDKTDMKICQRKQAQTHCQRDTKPFGLSVPACRDYIGR